MECNTLTKFTACFDFMNVAFEYAELFAQMTGSIANHELLNENVGFKPTEGKTITLTFNTNGQRIVFMCMCQAMLEGVEDTTMLSIVRNAKLGTIPATV